MIPEIGDVFIIVNGERNGNKPCLFANKTFRIKSFGGKNDSIVYYDDNRTNGKCRCRNCYNSPKINKSIPVHQIKVVQKGKARDRELKLKLLIK